MPHKALTHKDLARHLSVSETTIKSYRRKFPGCIPVANHGKPIRFNSEALAVCKRIRDLFDLGMSISEVHTRLAAEFPWVNLTDSPPAESAGACPPSAEKPGAPKESAAVGAAADPAPLSDNADNEPRPDLPLIVSSLAKSVISLSQQQSALLKRLDCLEAKIDNTLDRPVQADRSGGTAGHPMAAAEEALSEYNVAAPAPEPTSENGAQIVDKLDGIERALEQTMSLLGNYVETMQGFTRPAPAPGIEAAPAPPQTPAPGQDQPKRAVERKISEDYLRHLATLPLMHKTELNGLAHLGDRSRGVYTVNDLKAVFAQACRPPEHYTSYWHVQKGQSWFVLEQPENPHGRSLLLRITPVRTERGTEAAQIMDMVIDGREEPPATLYKTIQDLLG